MIIVDKKKWSEMENSDKITYCKGLVEDATKARETRDFEWYLNYQFMEGNHYVYYNTVTKKLERKPRTKGEVRITINKTKSTVRAVQNYSTRFAPKWEIIPGGLTDDLIANARRSGKFMDYLFRTLHLEIMLQGCVDSGLNTSVAWVELDWDEDAEDGLGQVSVIEHDPFDVWCDPRAKIYAGKVKGKYVFKGVVRELEEIKSDERYDVKNDTRGKKDKEEYNREMVKPDDRLAASQTKEKILRKEGIGKEDKTERAIVYEFQLYDNDKNEKGGHVQLFTFAGDRVLRDEALSDSCFSLYCMQIPQDTKKIYHRAWVSDIVPLNKALNRVVSQKIMYVNQALVFRVMAEKGHGINRVTNEQGDWWEYNKGRNVTQMQPYPLPADIDEVENKLNAYIEDAGGAHEAAVGRMPAGARSGKILESLQAADANNLSGIRISIESFLSVLGSAILDIVADKYVASRIAKITDPEIDAEGNKQNYISVVGQGAPEDIQKDESAKHTIINKGNTLIVKIGSWLGQTLEAQRETLFELADRKALPTEELLRQMEFANVDEISAKARDQRLEEHKMDAEIAGRNQPPQPDQGGMGAGMPGMGDQGKESKEVALADQENLQMVQGIPVPPTQGVGLEHTQAHVDFSQTNDFLTESTKNPAIKQAMQQHIQGELEMQGILGTEQQPMAPQGGGVQ